MSDRIIKVEDVVDLVNLTNVTSIDPSKISTSTDNIYIFRGKYKYHINEDNFSLLWLRSSVTRAEYDEVLSKYNTSSAHVVCSEYIHNRIKQWSKGYGRVKGIWTRKGYIRSFVSHEMDGYMDKVINYPDYFIEPSIESEKLNDISVRNLISFVVDSPKEEGRIGVLLAEPGQGKTYLAKYIASKIADRKIRDIIPILITSEQWEGGDQSFLADVWKTAVHSFMHYNINIGWIEGREEQFVRIMSSVGLFRFIFDGFDEFLLRNMGSIAADEVLTKISTMATTAGINILLTSRSSFWEDAVHQDIELVGNKFSIAPFSIDKSKEYFEVRFGSREDKDNLSRRAVNLFGMATRTNPILVGRGYALRLIADIAEREMDSDVVYNYDKDYGNDWLLEAWCRREDVRQRLSMTPMMQLNVIQRFVADTSIVGGGNSPDTDTLKLHIIDEMKDIEEKDMKWYTEKLKHHPIIRYDVESGKWFVTEEQVAIRLLVREMLKMRLAELSEFASRKKLGHFATLRNDVSETMVEYLTNGDDGEKGIMAIIPALTAGYKPLSSHSSSRLLAGSLALTYVDHSIPRGSPRIDRTAQLLRILNKENISGLHFDGVLMSFDFADTMFENCRFDGVSFYNCAFSEGVTFSNCHLEGGIRVDKTVNLSPQTFDDNCYIDTVTMNHLKNIYEIGGDRKYTEEDLDRDFSTFLRKFWVGNNIKTLSEANLSKGLLGRSRYYKEIVSVMLKYVVEYIDHVSGTSDKVMAIREDCKIPFKFYMSDGGMESNIARAYDELKRNLVDK